jgi:hypothetical protein
MNRIAVKNTVAAFSEVVALRVLLFKPKNKKSYEKL